VGSFNCSCKLSGCGLLWIWGRIGYADHTIRCIRSRNLNVSERSVHCRLLLTAACHSIKVMPSKQQAEHPRAGADYVSSAMAAGKGSILLLGARLPALDAVNLSRPILSDRWLRRERPSKLARAISRPRIVISIDLARHHVASSDTYLVTLHPHVSSLSVSLCSLNDLM